VSAEPNHERAASNLLYYEQILASDTTQQEGASPGCDGDDEPVNRRPVDTYKASTEFQIYERLCRGEQTHVRIWLSIVAVYGILAAKRLD